jgi:hypothetical protein
MRVLPARLRTKARSRISIADSEPIRQYLEQLRLSLRIPEVGRILVEAEDHLRAATAAGVAAGLTETEAQRAAIARFRPVSAIVYAHQTRHGRVAAMLGDLGLAAWRVAAYFLLTYLVVAGLEQLHSDAQGPALSSDVAWAAVGACGLVLLAAFYVVRHVRPEIPRAGRRVDLPGCCHHHHTRRRGLATSCLSDLDGPVGVAAQSPFITPR